jgi:hypothetical protein
MAHDFDRLPADMRLLKQSVLPAPAFSYLREIRTGNEGLVDQNSASWNRIETWLGNVSGLQQAA